MKLSLYCLICLMVPIAIAQEEENAAPPEVASEATPELFRDAEAGLSLRLAGGFGFLARQGSLVLFGSKQTPGMVFLELGETFSDQELIEASRSGYEDEGVSLAPDGAVVPLNLGSAGAGLAFPVRGTLDSQVIQGVLAGGRNRSGQCFILLVATTPQAWPRLAPVAQRIVAGIALFAPETPSVDLELRAYFAGSRLSFYFSRTSRDTSFQGTEQIYLCGDGSFFHGEQTRASFDVPQAMGYSRTGDNSSGKWSVDRTPSGAVLSLAFHDGRQWRYQATRLGSEVLYLNGSKYFRSGHTRCQ
jgi:hypothetical protein